MPTLAEDDDGRDFIGGGYSHLKKVLRDVGIDLSEDCWRTHALICHTSAKLKDVVVEYCRPNLVAALKEFQPDIIVPMGSLAIHSVLGHAWKDDVGSYERWIGWRIPCQRLNTWIVPTWHPAEVYRRKDREPLIERLFARHLAEMAALQGRPWAQVPEWEREVEVVLDPRKAARMIRKVIEKGGPTACDYETNSLKPDADDAEIITMSICWKGVKTFAYPWHGEAIDATGEYLRSERCGKIASNLKFEDRWTRRFFGHGVRNWIHDTMIAAHVIDNRTGITSIKFQAFVILGAESYDDHIKKYLKSAGGRKTNLVRSEIDIHQLLVYNGLDSLLEYKVAEVQSPELAGHVKWGSKQ
jgi:uracil-DNA glycosylase family 4